MRYKCSVCGYIYDEEKEGVKFADLPDDWSCPVCGEGKEGFEPMDEDDAPSPSAAPAPAPAPAPSSPGISGWEADGDLRELSAGEISAICSNLARGCGVQQLTREAQLFTQIADYFDSVSVTPDHDGVATLISMLNSDLDYYGTAKSAASMMTDRGSLRVLTWSEKASIILKSVLERYRDDPEFLRHTSVYVCDICGFMYIGDDPPAVCPVCKVPGHMILKVKGGA